MAFLIELSGSADGCAVKPTCGRSYTSTKGDEYYVDMELINRVGCEGFLRVDGNCEKISIPCIAFGMTTCVQVELPYPWSKHKLTSNVPIDSYCKNGYLESIFHVIKLWIKG